MYIISSGASARAPGAVQPLYGAPDEYTEYHENVLQSYRHQQFNIQLQQYTEVSRQAIWCRRMQQKLSAAGVPPGPRWVSLHGTPIPQTAYLM